MRSRTAILRSTAFLQHDTGDHPERASRMIAIDCELERGHLLVHGTGQALVASLPLQTLLHAAILGDSAALIES